jgi:hypothetical protein
MRLRRVAIIAGVLGGLVGGATAMAAPPSPPGPPPWVLPDGRVDLSMPRTLPLLDAQGRVVGHVNLETYANAEADGVIESTGP